MASSYPKTHLLLINTDSPQAAIFLTGVLTLELKVSNSLRFITAK
jgi:hypothetical protein